MPFHGLKGDRDLRPLLLAVNDSERTSKKPLKVGKIGDPTPPQVLASFANTGNGFDTIRLLAASAVILSHSFHLTGLAEPLALVTGGQTTIGGLAVSAFFFISGYLIPGSLDRGTLTRFAVKRARRIMPALVVAVLVCAFALGPLLTTLPARDYLASSATWRFVGNAAFLAEGYDLPGVFSGNPVQAANGSLWSLKYEMACYIGVPILFALLRLRKLAVALAWLGSFAVARLLPDDAAGVAYHINQLAELFRFFGTGMMLYLFADRVAIRAAWAWLALALWLASAFTPFFVEIAALAGSYALIVFSYLCSDRFKAITARGDISYGVYVYAFPIQQMLIPLSLGASAWGISLAWLANTMLAWPLAALAGLASWLLVERPALNYRRRRALKGISLSQIR